MSTLFISYAREDREKAQDLANQCMFRGADPWWDRELQSGERYIETILRQVAEADHFVLLLSEHSRASVWVAFEVGAARSREFSSRSDFIKIVNLDNCEPPGFIGERNATEMTGDDWGSLFRSLELPEDLDYKPPIQNDDTSLVVMRAGGQWMELIAGRRGLECVLVDIGEQRARIQWGMSPDEVIYALDQDQVEVDPPRQNRGWSLFRVGYGTAWRWTPELFKRADGPPAQEVFKARLKEHLEAVRRF